MNKIIPIATNVISVTSLSCLEWTGRTARGLLGILLLSSVLLSGCGGGASTEANPNLTSGNNVVVAAGIAANEWVLAYQTEVWPHLSDYCGNCHIQNQQSPSFARYDDINLAFNAAVTVANLSDPSASELVTRVGNGHNCWLSSANANAECAQIMTQWIENWVSTATGGVGGSTTITLTPPVYRLPGGSRLFPTTATANSPDSFAETVYALLRDNCAGCHSDSAPAALQQSPFFASADVNMAYEEAKPKIDLADGDIDPNSPIDMDPDVPGTDKQEKSRLVVRLRDQAHNCFNNDCEFSAITMRNAIIRFAGGIGVTGVDTNLVTSGALTYSEGLVASGGNRYENSIIAKWQFKAGSGSTISDVSGVGNPIPLALTGNYEWVAGYGVNFAGGRAQATTTNSRKLNDSINTTAGGVGQYSIEAWVVPANVSQQDKFIVSYSLGDNARNLTLGQSLYNYDFRNRAATTDANGDAPLSTDDADEVAQATLQHVVVTFSPTAGRKIYVNGVLRAEDTMPDVINNWNSDYAFVVGGDATGTANSWNGIVRFAAIYDQALTEPQIIQNFDAGVGEKRFLLFDIGNINGVPANSYIMFEVSQLDNYSYLFYKPTFINLDPAWTPTVSIPIEGMRIGINGNLSTVGQAYAPLSTQIEAAQYDSTAGQVLSNVGTIIPVANGPTSDEFFLSFEVLGSDGFPFAETDPAAPIRLNPAQGPDIGLRTFEEINITMSQLTGVNPATTASISGPNGTYTVYKQQFPSVENIMTYLPSHQMAISQLAMTYCDELVRDQGTIPRTTYFSGFDFSATASSAFNSNAKKNQIINPLLERMMNVYSGNPSNNLGSQPLEGDVRTELNNLIDTLTACGAACDTQARTEQVVKGTCAAMLGTAAMLVQ